MKDPITKLVVARTQIKICGDGAVMEALFTNSEASFPAGLHSYLHMADYMISYIYNQSCTERAGRNMNAIKSPDRRSLGDTALTDLVWLSFNISV